MYDMGYWSLVYPTHGKMQIMGSRDLVLYYSALRFTKGDEALADRVTDEIICHMDTILLTFDILRPVPRFRRLDRDTHELDDLFRQVFLKMMYYGMPRLNTFAMEKHFIPIHMVKPDEVEHVRENGRTTTMFGPLGCMRRFDAYDRVHGKDKDSITDVPIHVIEDAMLAFAMGGHERLGAESQVLCLPDALCCEIRRAMFQI
jgi:hypothetical protein